MLRDAVDEALEEGGAMLSTVFQQVREEGEEKNKLRVARNCLMKVMDIRTIAEITELPVERTESLKTAVRKENTAQP